jgi:hypothetical protein
MDITNNMNPSVIDLLGILLRAKNVAVYPDHEQFRPVKSPSEKEEEKSALTFHPYDTTIPLSGIVFNESSQNVSLTVAREGVVGTEGHSSVPRGVPLSLPSRMVRLLVFGKVNKIPCKFV